MIRGGYFIVRGVGVPTSLKRTVPRHRAGRLTK
jgi:hypothetical protein